MIIKHIKAITRPGRRDDFIAQQRVWNDAMSGQAGFLSVHVALDPDAPDVVYILIAMTSREALDRFMRGDHDDIVERTDMRALYEKLDIHVLDVVEPGPPALRLEVSPSRTGSGYQIALLSELYRLSASLRAATAAGVFDAIGDGGADVTRLAADLGLEPRILGRLLEALAAQGLVELDEGRVHLSEIAGRHLTRGRPGYLGDLVLHNTRPALWDRWGGLTEQLTQVADEGSDDHELFLRAMQNIARAGQAQSLLAAVDWSERERILDVGGALGDYSIALCRDFPDLQCTVFEQPKSELAARAAVEGAGLGDRIEVVTGDYRSDFDLGFDRPFDAVLVSNILRGETQKDARALLVRLSGVMTAGGLLVVQDLFTEDPPGRGPLLAALFGLHMPAAMNGSVTEVRELISEGGFEVLATAPLQDQIVANRVVVARLPNHALSGGL